VRVILGMHALEALFFCGSLLLKSALLLHPLQQPLLSVPLAAGSRSSSGSGSGSRGSAYALPLLLTLRPLGWPVILLTLFVGMFISFLRVEIIKGPLPPSWQAETLLGYPFLCACIIVLPSALHRLQSSAAAHSSLHSCLSRALPAVALGVRSRGASRCCCCMSRSSETAQQLQHQLLLLQQQQPFWSGIAQSRALRRQWLLLELLCALGCALFFTASWWVWRHDVKACAALLWSPLGAAAQLSSPKSLCEQWEQLSLPSPLPILWDLQASDPVYAAWSQSARRVLEVVKNFDIVGFAGLGSQLIAIADMLLSKPIWNLSCWLEQSFFGRGSWGALAALLQLAQGAWLHSSAHPPVHAPLCKEDVKAVLAEELGKVMLLQKLKEEAAQAQEGQGGRLLLLDSAGEEGEGARPQAVLPRSPSPARAGGARRSASSGGAAAAAASGSSAGRGRARASSSAVKL